MSIALKEYKCFCPECRNACHGLRALLGFQPALTKSETSGRILGKYQGMAPKPTLFD